MAETIITPVNKSFLSNNKYQFILTRMPNIEFFIQSITLPAMTLLSSETQTPFSKLSLPANQLVFDPLDVTIALDEDMNTWFEVYDWITQLGNPTGYNKIGNLTRTAGQNNSITSDATLTIKTNSNNPNIRVTFKDLYPSSISNIQFTSTEGQEFLTANINFNYTTYYAEKLVA
jgi:hypothetical protein